SGRLPGNRYVRIHGRAEFRREGDIYIAGEESLEPETAAGRVYERARRILFGPRLESDADATERLSILTGLAILGSDNISSSAYATEEAMRILALAGIGAFVFTTPIAIAIVGVLAIVVLSQSQVISAYPNGGGSYVVASDNLGTLPGLVAAVPPDPFPREGIEALSVLLILRAFASGSVGLTGSEAIANGVPSMEPDERRNATVTLVIMGTFFATIFLGLTFLAQSIGTVPDRSEQETLNSLITRSLVGTGPFYYVVQLATAIILALAANTGFTGFPRLASVLANDRFMPRQFAYRGERLAFSFGIVALA